MRYVTMLFLSLFLLACEAPKEVEDAATPGPVGECPPSCLNSDGKCVYAESKDDFKKGDFTLPECCPDKTPCEKELEPEAE